MTIAQVRLALARRDGKPTWVKDLAAGGAPAILIRANRAPGNSDAVLIRYAAPRGGYIWSAARHLSQSVETTRPDPIWLQQARASARPPAILSDILETP